MYSIPSLSITASDDLLRCRPSGDSRYVFKSPSTRISIPLGCCKISATTLSRVESSRGTRYQTTMYQRRPPITSWKMMTLRKCCWCNSAAKSGEYLYNSATPQWWWLGASNATTQNPADSREYTPSVSLVSFRRPRSMFSWATPLSSDSSLSLWMFRLF